MSIFLLFVSSNNTFLFPAFSSIFVIVHLFSPHHLPNLPSPPPPPSPFSPSTPPPFSSAPPSSSPPPPPFPSASLPPPPPPPPPPPSPLPIFCFITLYITNLFITVTLAGWIPTLMKMRMPACLAMVQQRQHKRVHHCRTLYCCVSVLSC